MQLCNAMLWGLLACCRQSRCCLHRGLFLTGNIVTFVLGHPTHCLSGLEVQLSFLLYCLEKHFCNSDGRDWNLYMQCPLTPLEIQSWIVPLSLVHPSSLNLSAAIWAHRVSERPALVVVPPKLAKLLSLSEACFFLTARHARPHTHT